jgi:hypothetical protein
MHITYSPSYETHNGIGFHTYMFLGTQLAFMLFSNKLSFNYVTLINHVETAL